MFWRWEAESQIKFECQLATLKCLCPHRWLTYRTGQGAAIARKEYDFVVSVDDGRVANYPATRKFS